MRNRTLDCRSRLPVPSLIAVLLFLMKILIWAGTLVNTNVCCTERIWRVICRSCGGGGGSSSNSSSNHHRHHSILLNMSGSYACCIFVPSCGRTNPCWSAFHHSFQQLCLYYFNAWRHSLSALQHLGFRLCFLWNVCFILHQHLYFYFTLCPINSISEFAVYVFLCFVLA